jgi:hypothetical protein
MHRFQSGGIISEYPYEFVKLGICSIPENICQLPTGFGVVVGFNCAGLGTGAIIGEAASLPKKKLPAPTAITIMTIDITEGSLDEVGAGVIGGVTGWRGISGVVGESIKTIIPFG